MTSTGEIDRLVSRVAAPIASSALARCAPGSFPKRMRRDLEDLAGMLADLARGDTSSLDRGFAYGVGGALIDLAAKAKGDDGAPLHSAGQALYAIDTLLDARGGNAHVTAEEALVSGVENLAAALSADPTSRTESSRLVALHDDEQRVLEVETRLGLHRFVAELAKAHGHEELRGIALATDDTLATLSAVACTDATALGEPARWLPSEWPLGDTAGCLALASALLQATYDAQRAALAQHRRRSFDTLVRALGSFAERASWLRADGCLVPLGRDVLFVVFSTDASEESERWSLEAAGQLNAPQIATKYREALAG